MRSRLFKILALAFGLTLLAAACSSDGSDSSANGSDDNGVVENGGEGDGGTPAGFTVDTDDCIDPDFAETAVEDTWKIGFSLPDSGPLAGVVGAFRAGYQARIDLANEADELGDVDIEVIYRDDEFQPDRAKTNVTEFIQKDGVHSLTTFGSGQVGAIADDQNANCVPLLYPSAGVQAYFDVEEFPWTAQFLIPNEREAAFDVALIQQRFPDGATVGIAENQTESGKGYSGAFQAAAEETDGAVEVVVIAPSTDPVDAATKLKAENPDVVYIAEVTPGCAAVLSAMDRVGFEPELKINASNCVSVPALTAAGSAADGVIVPAWSQDPTSEDFAGDASMTEYRDNMPAEFVDEQIATSGWIAADLTIKNLADAQEMDGGLSPANVMIAARSLVDYESPLFLPGITWTSTTDRVLGVTALQTSEWDSSLEGFVYVDEPIPVD